MGVYIKDMEMPKRCAVCQAAFPNGVDFSCCLIKGYPIIHHETRLQNCPLIPVPDHGRLIDADALIDYCKHFAAMYKESTLRTDKARRDELLAVIGEIINMPTIIPAEPPKEETC